MPIPKRLFSSRRRKFLWLVLAILAVSLIFQRQYARRSATARSEAYAQHIDQTIREAAALRLERVETGALWRGALHEDVAASDNAAAEASMSTSLAGQRRISVDAVPVGSDHPYHVAMDIHECHPGSDACSSGGSIRLMTAAGTTVFSCELGMLLPEPARQSYYSLLWNPAGPSMTTQERLQLLKGFVAGGGRPDASTFFDNLQFAYRYTNHYDGPGKRETRQLWQNVLKAIIADHEQNAPARAE